MLYKGVMGVKRNSGNARTTIICKDLGSNLWSLSSWRIDTSWVVERSRCHFSVSPVFFSMSHLMKKRIKN